VPVTTLSHRTAERIARNEDAFRHANERIASAAHEMDEDFEPLPVICECAALGCTEIARVTLAEYEEVRASGRTFLVVPGHEITVEEGLTIARLRKKFEAFSLMDERIRRIGQNEALFRQVNEELERLTRGIAEIADETFHLVCECGDIDCQKRLVVAVRDYEAIRAESALFFVLPGHEKPSAEDVVAVGRAYNVVRKRPGGPEEIARATDPRR
jgi:hypothetical protein